MFVAIFMILGWLLLVSGNVVWIGHGIYELFTTDQGFFTVLFSNGLYWLIQMVSGFISLALGYALLDKK